VLTAPEHPETDNIAAILHAYFSNISSTKTIDSKQPEWRAILHTIMAVNPGAEEEINEPTIKRVHPVHFLKTAWFRYAAAVIILFGVGTYLWTITRTTPANTVAVKPIPIDVMPGGQRATLTLADGSTIVLDSAANGRLAEQNGSQVIKQDGEIIYDQHAKFSDAVTYNTMSTPKGGQYQLTLSDGTKVWLNAASKITYPTVFNKIREVKIEGEVYFEVTKNSQMPFVVKTAKDEIQVLGTEFNINSYPDEEAIKTSLINGSVKVNDKILQPGQAFTNGKIIKTNITQDIAWKNGLFDFNKQDFAVSMRQLERWYDIEVVYDEAVPKEKFYGEIGRNLTLQEVLEGLQGVIGKFRLEGKTLHVLP
ncbi:MAG: FecR family protein, partial [Chitinophagaceae bacterium]|nr:FecR family protein [Chitinophagaceae bacterium]